ncbi:MAG: ABC transporter permease [Candidatus Nanoarchaeia archaeon]|nr:ABC transporter permease [Candidatus Nanoarchaeia archaeon]
MKLLEFLKKEFILFKRNKKQMGIVIALPLIFALIYTLMFSFSSVNISLSICSLDEGEYADMFVNSLTGNFKVNYFKSNDSDNCFNLIKDDIVKGYILGLRMPKDFSSRLLNYTSPTIDLFIDNSKPNLGFFAQSLLTSSINDFNYGVISSAQETLKDNTEDIKRDLEGTVNMLEIIKPNIPSVTQTYFDLFYSNVNAYKTSISTLNNFNLEFVVKPVNTNLMGIFMGNNNKGFSFSVLYIVLSVLVIVLLSSMSIIYDKKNNFIIRLRAGKNNLIPYIFSKIIFFSMIGFVIFIPSFLVFLMDNAFFNINIISLITSIFLISSTWTFIGCIIGFSSKDDSSGIMISIFIGFLVLLLSGLFYPLEFLPQAVKYITMILPTSLHTSMLNNALIFNASIPDMLNIFINNLYYDLILLIICIYFLMKPIRN